MTYRTMNNKLKYLTPEDLSQLNYLSTLCRNLRVYTIKEVIKSLTTKQRHPSYNELYHLSKECNSYKLLSTSIGQSVIRRTAQNTKKKSKEELLSLMNSAKFEGIIIPASKMAIKNNYYTLPISKEYKRIMPNIKPIKIYIPPMLNKDSIKEIRIVMEEQESYSVHYIYETKIGNKESNWNNVMGIDLGVNNLIAGVDNLGHTYLIDGKRLKSIIYYHQKRLKQIRELPFEEREEQLKELKEWFINQKRDYICKACKIVIQQAKTYCVGTIIVGYNKEIKQNSRMNKVNNKMFQAIPYHDLRKRLKDLCDIQGIRYIELEESYTSKSSFFDNDEIPLFIKGEYKSYSFSGKRIKRGLYESKEGLLINSDIHAALNILKKSNLMELKHLQDNRGLMANPTKHYIR